jgi:hypothetical protein
MAPKKNYTSYEAVTEQLSKLSPALRFQDGYDIVAFNATVAAAGKIPSNAIHCVVPISGGADKCYENKTIRDIIYAGSRKSQAKQPGSTPKRPPVNYDSYESVQQRLCLLEHPCRFLSDYNEQAFIATRDQAQHPYNARHPVVVVDTGYTITDSPIDKICNGKKLLIDPTISRKIVSYDKIVQDMKNAGFVMNTTETQFILDNSEFQFMCVKCSTIYNWTLTTYRNALSKGLSCGKCKNNLTN